MVTSPNVRSASELLDMVAITRGLFARHLPYAEKFRPYYGRIDMRMIEDVLAMADTGIMTPIADLGRESSSLDPHLLTVAQKRFGSLAALDIKVEAAACTKSNGLDQKVADEMADDVRSMVKAITNRQDAIYDLAWSLFDGRGALEIDWVKVSGRNPYQPASLEWIHPRRIAFGPDRELRVIDTFTSGRGWWSKNGFALRDYPGKFITWEPRYFSDYPEREGLLRRSMYWSLFKRFSARMRMVLTELFAIPWRTIEFPATTEFHETSYEDLDEAEERAEALGGQNTVAMPPGARLNVQWPGENSGALFELTRTGVNEEMSKLWLGNVGTTDAIQTGMGSNVATVHKGEQNIYLTRDAFGIGSRFKQCLVDVWVVLNRGPDALVYAPTCTLTAEDEADRVAEQTARGTAIASSVPVGLADYYESAQIEAPSEDEPVIVGVTDPTTGKVTTKIVYPKDWDGPRIGETPPPAPAPGAPPGGGTPPGAPPPTDGGPPTAPSAPKPPGAPAPAQTPKPPTAPTAPPAAAAPAKPTVAKPGDVHSHIKAVLGLERPAPRPSGTEDQLVERHVKEACRYTAGWCRTMLDAIDDQGTHLDAHAALTKAAATLPLEAYARCVERSAVLGLALGAMDSAYESEHDHEARVEQPSFAADNAREHPRALVLGVEGVLGGVPPMVAGFTTKPFNEAIAEFMGKAVLPRRLFDRLTAEAKRRAFTIAGLSQQRMLEVAHDELTKSIADGDSLATFRERLAQRFETNGWTPLNRSHVETVFRTAVNGAYASGRHVQMSQPAVLAARPYWQIRGVKDDRARDTHAAARDKVLHASDPFWTRAPLPWGFNERCSKTSRSAADLARLGLSVSSGADIKDLPDEGFDGGGKGGGFAFERSLFGYEALRLANGRRLAGQARLYASSLLVLVDRPMGTVETGVGKDGTPWSRTWGFDGGELPGTSAGDGQPIDVFCGPGATAPLAFWIVQRGDDPELRLALGWASIDEARAAYLSICLPEMLDRLYPQPVEHVKALLGLPPDARMLEVRRMLDGHDDQARDDHGRFAPGGGGSGSSSSKKEPPTMKGSGGLAGKMGGLLSKAAGKAVAAIKASPGALKAMVLKQVNEVKTAALGIKAALTPGATVSHEQKAAMKSVAIKIATKVAFSAIGGALPGIGHAVGAALEHLPHLAEIIAHHVAHHAAEHTIEHLAKHAFKVHTSALRALEAGEEITDAQAGAFVDQVCDSVSAVLEGMSDDDWEKLLGPHLPAVEPKKADHTRQPRKPDGDFAPPARAPGHAGKPPAGATLPPEHDAAIDAATKTAGLSGDEAEEAERASSLAEDEPSAEHHTAAATAHARAGAACAPGDHATRALHTDAALAHHAAAKAFHEHFFAREARTSAETAYLAADGAATAYKMASQAAGDPWDVARQAWEATALAYRQLVTGE